MDTDWLIAKVSEQEQHLRQRRLEAQEARQRLDNAEQLEKGARGHYDYWKGRLVDAIQEGQSL